MLFSGKKKISAASYNKEIKLINKCKKNYEIENSKSLNVSLHSI